MTAERRLVVGLGDIRAVTLECKRCRARITRLPDDKQLEIYTSCPSCNHPWWSWPPGHLMRPLPSAFNDLVKALRDARELQGQDDAVGFQLLLEFDEPKP